MKQPVFTGSGVAIITPFTNEGVDYGALAQLLEFQLQNGTDAVIVCGTTGEAATMTPEERSRTIETVVDKVGGRVPVIAGTGSNCTETAIVQSREAEAAGVDGVLVVTPYYNKATQRGLVRHYQAIADKVTKPVILYKVPSRTGVNIAPKTALELSKNPLICGIKEASGNISQIGQVAALCGDELPLYSGNDDQVVPILSLGGKGVISVVANVAPAAMHRMCQLWFEGKTAESLALQLELMGLCNAMFCDVNPIPVKAALNMMGFAAGPCRLPLVELSEENAALVRRELEKAALL